MGPLVHLAAMQQCSDLLEQAGIYVDAGNIIDNMRADKELDSHGYSFESNTGSILNKIVLLSSQLSVLDKSRFDHTCRLICHLCVDSFSVGQISGELWGKYDNRIDAAGELVYDKKKYPAFRISFGDPATYQKNYMQDVYKKYKGNAKKLRFLVSSDLTEMVRNAVKLGAEFAYNWITISLK
jgi:hypothetical protein